MPKQVHRCLLHTLEAAAAETAPAPACIASPTKDTDVASYLNRMEQQMQRKACYQQQHLRKYSSPAPLRNPAANARPRLSGVATLMQPISFNCPVSQPPCFRTLYF